MKITKLHVLTLGFSAALAAQGPTITDISISPSGATLLYDKLEITFSVTTAATNLYWPYDASPPTGIPTGTGITVNAEFTPDNWTTTHTVPAFYYQEFQDQIKGPDPLGDREWFYPTGNAYWKARFSPFSVGTWKYRLTAQDSGGSEQTAEASFMVTSSNLKGIIRVSQNDVRYFEHANGTYFPALGFNAPFNNILNWRNPVLDNTALFQTLQANGIQLIRHWLWWWGIFSEPGSPWEPKGDSTLNFSEYPTGSRLSFKLTYPEVPAESMAYAFQGQHQPRAPVKQGTAYRVRVRAKTVSVTGPRIQGYSYGLVLKVGEWLIPNATEPGIGTVVTTYMTGSSGTFQEISGTWNSGSMDFFPAPYLVLENVNSGTAYIDEVILEEDLGGGNYGPNAMRKGWMTYHYYVDQRNAYAFDKLLNLAKERDVYFRLTLGEKQDRILDRFNNNGDPTCIGTDACYYGDYRNMTMVRWLQRSWWRYAQARWGYSPNVHSWEMLNEGDWGGDRHFTMADEFGIYMKAFPNAHPTNTSTWYPASKASFWGNANYPNVDWADFHGNECIPVETCPVLESSEYADSALSHKLVDDGGGAKTAGGSNKPMIRGEMSFLYNWDPSTELLADTNGIWLHNLLWAQLYHGGVIESYWYVTDHIHNTTAGFDHRPEFGKFYRFIKDIPLNNGNYVDAAANSSNSDIRAWGQKDLTNKRAHLWIANANHTWKNVVDQVPIDAESGTVTISGFTADASHTLKTWDTYQSDPNQQITKIETVKAAGDGSIMLSVSGLTTDYAVTLEPYDFGVRLAGATSAQAVISYTAPDMSACTVEVSEESDYSPWVRGQR